MTTPDADDASPSPEYSGDPDGSDMAAEQKNESKSGAASPSQKTSGNQKPNAKDPLRPRRKKARRACFACQRAHLTCGDERPCNRCIRRGLQDHCMDGVRKKAKYLHDAPDGALMPGVGGHYPHMNGNHSAPLPGQDPTAPQGAFYTQAPSSAFYDQNAVAGQVPAPVQDGQPYTNPQAPISPPYSQTNQGSIASVPSTISQGASSQVQQFGGPLFDPSDPALFNFDISSLNFGNHYGALEMGMLGHMSSGAAETPPNDNSLMNPLNQAANVYNPQMSSGPYDNQNMPASVPFGPDGLPGTDWQNAPSRHGSMQIQTPNNTPVNPTLDHVNNRYDSLNGPHAYAIGQGAPSISSASPASTDVNSGYDNENPLSAATFFANSHQQQVQQRSPTVNRGPQENRVPNTALQPIQSNAIRKRRRETSWIYESITKPYDYVGAFHRLKALVQRRYPAAAVRKITERLGAFRPVLLTVARELDLNDLIHTEKNLQRSLMSLTEQCDQVGTPSLICRRTGEIVGLNKEFTILTGWQREVLIGQEPNLNVNTGITRDPVNDSGLSTRTSTTPNLTGQEPDNGPHPVNIIELMDEASALQYFEDFSELAYVNARGCTSRRVHMLKYRTKEDVARMEEIRANAMANGKDVKNDSLIKLEGGPVHPSEAAMQKLGAKDGILDCMVWWHIKRDNFDLPMLICMQIMPVLPGPVPPP